MNPAPTPRADAAIDELANAFLRWHLPESVRSDLCATMQGPGRVGTNLLSFIEARQMMRDIVGPALTQLRAKVETLNSENAELLKERDEAEDAADKIASEVLGESIDWPFHDAAWRRAAEAAKEMRFELHMRRNSPAMDEVIKLRAQLAAARAGTANKAQP